MTEKTDSSLDEIKINKNQNSPGEFARVNRVMLSKNSEEYLQRRERNNAAVKKSRFKSKQKTLETQKRVEQLKHENAQLERRLESLTREFSLMRDIFVPRRSEQQQLQQPFQVPLIQNSIGENVRQASP